MKKILSIILAAVMITSVLASCASNSPAADGESQSKQEISSLVPAESQTEETESAQEEVSTAPVESKEEKKQENKESAVKMTADQQYSANIFLSNFAEQGFGNYDKNSESDPAQLLRFAYFYNKINNGEKNVEYVKEGERDYSKYSLKNINSTLDRFFGIKLTNEQASKAKDSWYFFKDGNFYIVSGDGEARNTLAVVDSLTKLKDGTYKMNFKIYELDLDVYYGNNGGSIAKKYYQMTGAQAAKSSDLKVLHEGTAIAKPYKNNGKDTYQLISYDVER